MLPRRSLINIRLMPERLNSSSQCKPIKKLLISNRGEIACRIIRTARRLDIATIAVYSETDRDAMHVRLADSAYHIGPSAASLSYLNQERIFDIARRCQADAIHPGYGFLSENATFAEACVQNGLIFVGPSSSAMRAMGSKDKAKEIMLAAGVPTVDGYHGADQSDKKLRSEANRIGYPVMLKAVCSGGGKGMRAVMYENEFFSHLHSARSEAKSSFGDDRMIVEKFIHSPRHVEMQIFGDNYGNYVHLFERDCSAQRRCQKLIEEAPAPLISNSMRQRMGKAAIAAASSVNYAGAGTVEFLIDKDGKQFYFMEMNTRLQVEHPVTEMITGMDLVEWQLRIASGEPLPIRDQSLIIARGHSFEARLYAENPLEDFAPSPGRLVYFDLSSLENLSNIRLEMGYQQGDCISSHYDPLIGKIIAWDIDRTSALQRLHFALANLRLCGVGSNMPFLLALCQHTDLATEGSMYTQFIGDHFEELLLQCKDEQWLNLAACWAHLGCYLARRSMLRHCSSDPFKIADGFRINLPSVDDKLTLRWGKAVMITSLKESPPFFSFKVGEEIYKITCARSIVDIADTYEAVKMDAEYANERFRVTTVQYDKKAVVYCSRFPTSAVNFELAEPAYTESMSAGEPVGEQTISSPLPGIVEQIVVASGQQVKKGDTLLVMVAMKMECSLKAPFDAVVDRILCRVGDSVPKGAKLIYLADSDVADS
ncbi:CPSase L D2 and Biotin lipoyl and Biotin carb C a nd CPSase L chain domain containing protein [Trichuris trichiura]|uniref:CPSase L D2 and Biotin lipoyl and Biotin carb C a nd CPSase L chain domain containing protein n=1 Tax=Trichuris trichiura TaxID=36087 RepID=A0A077Z0H4_TRITR|nr:CPSase L D2 and Biotin lipoyl and Biotin carb C a nd CPSase L chain domain containing protein [Trichuris trichiura]